MTFGRAELRPGAIVVLVSACVACGPTNGNAASLAAPAAHASPVASGAPAIDEVSRENDQADRRTAEVLEQVAVLRELPPLGRVHARVINRSQMLEQLQKQVRAQVPPEAIRGERDFLASFGFIPHDYDYEAEVYRLIQNQIAGFYDPDEKTMFLMADLSSEEADVTLAHELVHALQDQHFDLGPKLAYQANGNDEQSAVHCLAEGDATSLMLDYTLRVHRKTALDVPDDRLRLEIMTSIAASPELASFPRVLRDSLIAPYVDGIMFVHALRRRGGWREVDQVWRHPPVSTEQVLHLDKLDARESPEELSVPPTRTLGSGWHVTHSEVFGEQGLRIALEEWMPRKVAVRSAAGWAGDRSVVWSKAVADTSYTAAAWHVRFDPGKPPAGVDDEAREALLAVANGWDVGLRGGSACRGSALGITVAVAQRGRDLAFVALPPRAVADSTQPSTDCSLAIRWAAEIVATP